MFTKVKGTFYFEDFRWDGDLEHDAFFVMK